MPARFPAASAPCRPLPQRPAYICTSITPPAPAFPRCDAGALHIPGRPAGARGLPGSAAATGRTAMCCRASPRSDTTTTSTATTSPPITAEQVFIMPPDMIPRNPDIPVRLDDTIGHSSRMFTFSDNQIQVIVKLRASIAKCVVAFSAVAGTNILLSSVQAFGLTAEEGPTTITGGFTVGDVAYWADSTMLVTLLLFALGPLDTVIHSKVKQIKGVFQGLDRLGLIFQQLIIGSFAVSTVTLMEAAVKYPPIVVFSSEVFFALAILRAAAMGYVLRAHINSSDGVVKTLGALRSSEGSGSGQLSLPERWAVMLAFGYLVQHEERTQLQSTMSMNWDEQHYEFTVSEERVLKSMTESVNTAGMALGLQAFSVLMLAVAAFGTEDWSGVVSNGINCSNKVLMAALVFQASQSFDRALHSVGTDDVDHLLNGLGEHGLTEMFNKLSILAWAVSFAALVGVTAPWLEDSVALTALSDAASHHTAEMVVEGVEDVVQMMRGI